MDERTDDERVEHAAEEPTLPERIGTMFTRTDPHMLQTLTATFLAVWGLGELFGNPSPNCCSSVWHHPT